MFTLEWNFCIPFLNPRCIRKTETVTRHDMDPWDRNMASDYFDVIFHILIDAVVNDESPNLHAIVFIKSIHVIIEIVYTISLCFFPTIIKIIYKASFCSTYMKRTILVFM